MANREETLSDGTVVVAKAWALINKFNGRIAEDIHGHMYLYLTRREARDARYGWYRVKRVWVEK